MIFVVVFVVIVVVVVVVVVVDCVVGGPVAEQEVITITIITQDSNHN